MKPFFNWTLIVGVIVLVGYFILWFLSSYLGWYGFEQWKYRHGTTSIEEAERRKVFVKELNFKVENYFGDIYNFKPYIETGFTYGPSLFGSDSANKNRLSLSIKFRLRQP